uniref:Uncharacterized protein n=1 Tax=Branchiostoma floridae TaxID=7739 RepID=C3Y845_BRAFL|eukprot:XP_002607504.1 hypothetical protein BRAFLDRAFT_69935 [Branchiostoma floridae]
MFRVRHHEIAGKRSQGCGGLSGARARSRHPCVRYIITRYASITSQLSASAARDTGACRGPCPIATSMCTLHHHEVRVDNVTIVGKRSQGYGGLSGPVPDRAVHVYATSSRGTRRQRHEIVRKRSQGCGGLSGPVPDRDVHVYATSSRGTRRQRHEIVGKRSQGCPAY